MAVRRRDRFPLVGAGEKSLSGGAFERGPIDGPVRGIDDV